MRVAVIRAGALGDVVLTLPAIHALRAAYPASTIDAVGYPSIWDLAGPLVDRHISIDEPRFGGLSGGEIAPLQTWAQEYDLVVAWTSRDPTSALAGAPGTRVIHRPPLPPPGVHAATWLLESLPAEARLSYPAPLLSFTHRELDEAREVLAGTQPIIIHPGAGAVWKRWPAERFAAVGGALREWGHDVLLVSGPADADVVRCVLAHADFEVRQEPSIRRLAAILSQASLVIGNDSGVTHLAAAAGAPTVAIFGPTDPGVWAPLGATVVRACRRRAEVAGEIRVCHDPACLSDVTVEQVLEVIRRRGYGTAG